MESEIAYLHGALHDGYVYTGKSKGKVAVITQKNREWLVRIQRIVELLNTRSWIFQQRNIHVLETKLPELLKPINVSSLKHKDALEYVAGFFDAEGGIPKNPIKSSIVYIQFVQKNKTKLEEIVKILEKSGIKCGKIHQYDKKKSGCWRFFINRESHLKFIETINSRHPEKQERLRLFADRLLER